MNVEVDIRRASSDLRTVTVLNIASRPQQTIPGATLALTWTKPLQLVSIDEYFAVVDTATEFAEGMAYSVNSATVSV